MRRLAAIVMVLACAVPSAAAKELQTEIQSRWLGAWAILRVDSYSDCAGLYTDNRVNGVLVRSAGGSKFGTGELARVDKVDLRRSRLDVLLRLVEPVLVPYQDGPFTLYREASCKVELEVELPRSDVKTRQADAIDRRLAELLERHPNETAARGSRLYNGRERDPYPRDYARTVRRHAVWRAEQDNAVVQERIDTAVEETSHAVQRVQEHPAYLAGFGEGVEAARKARLESCGALLALDLAAIRARTARDRQDVDPHRVDGFGDGQLVALGVELVRRLPSCFVPVPDARDESGESTDVLR